ncbi:MULTISPECIES: excinuclease ABC subunit UvrA [unclassified Arcicella]|uniref:excinuclease ABC subunit UvrA n=1 Tax=unclassified Arcicella TaxID=2644986 RepID=UPI00285EB08D|nr:MULTISPECIES: excinuclease ABC subunit UvrA [unclassified Arcicella]MDR6564109.1 excinuclease ABC subunit A [Arcicella sp. BE51]MDR6813862.1 excinuclease ABC subunit A [Arcicella sp. BE140]MDR6825174.1 excinuclease ABC subunit A [Arcicella sp. BE139]
MNNTEIIDQNHIAFEDLDPKRNIIIKGARVNNLKNIDVAIPRNKLVVITGLSGSGKSSLAFDTLFAEGQRMYVESLSAYTRQFLGRMEKPDVDYIKGISPAIAIEQKVSSKNPRSTVGTTTEIYDYLKLLFARIGITYSPISGNPVKKDTVTDVVNYLFTKEEGQRVMVLSPLYLKEGRKLAEEMKILLQKGYTRIVIDGETKFLEELLEDKTALKNLPAIDLFSNNYKILIDRVVIKKEADGQPDEETQFRLSDSVQTAFFEGNGTCFVEIIGEETKTFSDRFEADGIVFEEPSLNLLSFNNPYGACKRCEGFGRILGLDPDLIIPDKGVSVYEGAIAPWRTEKMSEWLVPLLKNATKFDFPIHRPYKDLTDEQKEVLWTGNEYFYGLNDFFAMLEKETHKIQYRVMLSRYRGRTTCPDCKGSRLRKDAGYVKISGKSIIDLVLMPLSDVSDFFKNLDLPDYQYGVSKRILIEIETRLEYMEKVGLGYLTLNRLSSTLSGGEFQRIKLATSLGSALVGSMYILDEPSIGLHPRDTQRLVSVLESLRDMGNTVIVVEHEEEVMRAADQIIDIGPDAGSNGGKLVFQGNWETINDIDAKANPDAGFSHTINFLTGRDTIEVPKFRRKSTSFIEVKGAYENNLKDVNVKFPLGILIAVTGVSGSGKSTLIRKILYPALGRHLGTYTDEAGKYAEISGSIGKIEAVEMVDQNPIGKSSRSNPVTYVKAYDQIRLLYSEQPIAKARGYKPAHFSFNVEGGRCETCQGEGFVTIEMQFMADVKLKCESCGGKRFKQEILDVKFNDKDIADLLDMPVDEAIELFRKDQPKLADKLLPLQEVGLGYVKLGQSSNSLSGGEAQRVKLASFLGKGNPNKGKTLFIFDEPTTGLHFHDIKKLLKAINALVEQGDSVIIIEHNMEVIKSSDYIIDLGPEGGEKGGFVTFEGTPELMVELEGNYTADFLKQKLS